MFESFFFSSKEIALEYAAYSVQLRTVGHLHEPSCKAIIPCVIQVFCSHFTSLNISYKRFFFL